MALFGPAVIQLRTFTRGARVERLVQQRVAVLAERGATRAACEAVRRRRGVARGGGQRLSAAEAERGGRAELLLEEREREEVVVRL